MRLENTKLSGMNATGLNTREVSTLCRTRTYMRVEEGLPTKHASHTVHSPEMEQSQSYASLNTLKKERNRSCHGQLE